MNITVQAANELKKVLDNFGKEGAGIRIFSARGCCGPSVQMDVAQQIANGETNVFLDGIDFFVANELLSELTDVTVDFGPNGFRLTGLKKSGSSCCG